MQVDIGDTVRVDIPDESDPDFDRYHRRCGTIVEMLTDDAGETTGDDRDNELYRVEFTDGDTQDFRWRDLRPIPK
ncbi:hypothetical protein [Halobacterium salinarum]|uniref:hypothetical protein n=1 Tax=Halobacterium salinarum TaxID=2242 RepID=UPI002564775A|nr:hypothetical protein [Halobacterium salinarum]